MPKKLNPARFKAKARKYFLLREAAKNLYLKSDAIAAEIVRKLGGGVRIDIGEGHGVLTVDNYIDAEMKSAAKPVEQPNPIIWAHGAARRYELEMK